MSTENTSTKSTSTEPEPPKEAPKPKESPKPKKTAKVECPSPSSPDGKHSDFFNEGTEETYCRFCGRTA